MAMAMAKPPAVPLGRCCGTCGAYSFVMRCDPNHFVHKPLSNVLSKRPHQLEFILSHDLLYRLHLSLLGLSGASLADHSAALQHLQHTGFDVAIDQLTLALFNRI